MIWLWALLLCNSTGGGSSLSSSSSTAATSSSSREPPRKTLRLQEYHPPESPQQIFQNLSNECHRQGIEEFDVYGDFHRTNDDEQSFLRQFEGTLAKELGKEDAVFMPSGVMAQSIALLIHRDNPPRRKLKKPSVPVRFACHHSSHLLLHEQESYRKLLGMEPVILSTIPEMETGQEAKLYRDSPDDFVEVPALRFEDVSSELDQGKLNESGSYHVRDDVSTLILELPHREIGGKLTPWPDVLKMRDYCQEHAIAFHCDGARLFEANAGYETLTLREMADVFDSVYISFYKGLGGLSGAMLLGTQEFCDEARVWLRRFGGNLFTLMPYVISAYSGYQRYWADTESGAMSFVEKRDKLRRVVTLLQGDSEVAPLVRFDPLTPEVNMVHGYMRASEEECSAALDSVSKSVGIRVLHRVRAIEEPCDEKDDGEQPLSSDHHYRSQGYRTKFEWTLGEANGRIPDAAFVRGWTQLAQALRSSGSLEDSR